MSLESAVVPRDTKISQLERMVSEREDMVEELRQQRGEYVGKLADANRKIVELDTRCIVYGIDMYVGPCSARASMH